MGLAQQAGSRRPAQRWRHRPSLSHPAARCCTVHGAVHAWYQNAHVFLHEFVTGVGFLTL